MDVTIIGFLVGGLVLLLLGGSCLVRGASQLAHAVGMSSLVVGLTVVAFGTSAPELAASAAAVWRGQGDVAFGNVVGSNIFNILVILGASAMITPLVVAQKLIRVDVPLLIGLSLAVLVLGSDGRVGRVDGLILVAALAGYVIYSVRTARTEPPEIRSEYERGYGPAGTRRGLRLLTSVGFVLGGLVLLVWGSRWLVEGAVGAARALGTSELIIGLTVVAAGTSLPEVATSMLAAWKGERDIAVGNVVGSSIFNLLGVLGVSALAAPGGLPASSIALRFDVPVMIATSVACLPIFFTEHRIARWEGVVLLAYYVAYVAFLVLDAYDHDRLPVYSWIMAAFVLPLTAVTFAVVAVRQLRQRGGQAAPAAARRAP